MTLIGHWPLTEDSGSTAKDYSGNGNDGTITGAGPAGTGTVNGPLGQSAYDFDGNDDYVDTNVTFDSVFGPDTGAFCAWFKSDTNAESANNPYDGHHIVGEASEYAGLTYVDNGSGNQIFAYGFDGTSTFPSGYDYTTGNWVHLVWIHVDGTLYLYVNGNEFDSVSLGSLSNATDTMYIGTRDPNNFRTEGQIADVRFYDRALSPQEISYLYEVSQRGKYVSETKTL